MSPNIRYDVQTRHVAGRRTGLADLLAHPALFPLSGGIAAGPAIHGLERVTNSFGDAGTLVLLRRLHGRTSIPDEALQRFRRRQIVAQSKTRERRQVRGRTHDNVAQKHALICVAICI